jgi:hypothetical protein
MAGAVAPRVGVARERARAVRPELRRALEVERLDVGHPRERVVDERRQGRTPLAGVAAADAAERRLAVAIAAAFGAPVGAQLGVVTPTAKRRTSDTAW